MNLMKLLSCLLDIVILLLFCDCYARPVRHGNHTAHTSPSRSRRFLVVLVLSTVLLTFADYYLISLLPETVSASDTIASSSSADPGHPAVFARPFLLHLLTGLLKIILLAPFFSDRCGLDRMSAIYIGIWSVLSAALASELSFLTALPLAATTDSIWWHLLLHIIIPAALLIIVSKTIARSMPANGTYQIGPRQFTSALTLAFVFLVPYSYMVTRRHGADIATAWLIILLLAQGYALSLLYVQTELFKKSAMKKEMAAINALLYKRRQQYDVARQNVQLINRRCHDLRLIIAELRQRESLSGTSAGAQTTDLPTQTVRPDVQPDLAYLLNRAEEAADIYSDVVKTGNDVLDTVLTDKSLLCESRGIQISVVADGPAMAFIEAVDIYTIFNSILDAAIDAVSILQNTASRTIDIMIYKRQNFLIVNIIHPMSGAVRFRDGLPVPRNSAEREHSHGNTGRDEYDIYNLKAVRQVLKRYDGLLNCEEKNSVFTYRMVIPVNG